MRKAVLYGIAVLALVASAWRVGQAQTQVRLSEFKMAVQVSKTGLTAQCLQGCEWKEITFTCDAQRPCNTEIDQFGVAGK